MPRYLKCPRCDLNYINVEVQEYCDICLSEMKGERGAFSDLTDEDEEMELCPRCGENMMKVGETMCDECKKRLDTEEEEIDIEKDEGWRDFVEDEPEDILPDAPDALDDFEDEEEEDDLYHGEEEEEDMDYVTADEAANMDFDDDDDDNEDDDF